MKTADIIVGNEYVVSINTFTTPINYWGSYRKHNSGVIEIAARVVAVKVEREVEEFASNGWRNGQSPSRWHTNEDGVQISWEAGTHQTAGTAVVSPRNILRSTTTKEASA